METFAVLGILFLLLFVGVAKAQEREEKKQEIISVFQKAVQSAGFDNSFFYNTPEALGLIVLGSRLTGQIQ